ncbi:MAG: zinc ribbon domain-containing protein [Phycisphaerales bacterium]|nr:zinc ribbon domain-containing protein [Phycisphaerales bacterium]
MPTRWLNRRLIARASIFLLLGAIINVAVAWACVYPGAGGRRVGLIDDIHSELPWWQNHAPLEWKSKYGFSGEVLAPGFDVQLRYSDPSIDWGKTLYGSVRAGLPLKSMRGHLWCITTYDDGPGRFQDRVELHAVGLWRLESELDVEDSLLSSLPLRPLWCGFLFNSALYGGVLWILVLAAPRKIITRRRLKHGRCPNCNYDLRATATGVCPECGTLRS